MIALPQHFPRACQFVYNHQWRKEEKKKTGQNGMRPFYREK